MALTLEQQQTIRDEEFFRTEVRKSLAAPPRPPTLFDRLSAFADSKVGFWLLTTVLAGLIATGFTQLQRYMDREETARRERADISRRDAEMLLKLGPMLTSEKGTQRDMAIVLLDSLVAGDGIDKQVSTQIVALIRTTTAAGDRPNATPEQRAASQSIYSYFDRAGAWGMPTSPPTPSAAPTASTSSGAAVPVPAPATRPLSTTANSAPGLVATALNASALPARIYLQLAATKSCACKSSSQIGAQRPSGGRRQLCFL